MNYSNKKKGNLKKLPRKSKCLFKNKQLNYNTKRKEIEI